MSQDSDGSPTVIDLFCGAGGLSDGLRQAGFDAVAGVDFDKHAIATYKANHPNATPFNRDIADVSADDLRATLGGRELDLIAGGPSCQGFSTIGKRVEDDPRNVLFRHFARLVREMQPKFFLMENVKGLLAYRKGYFQQLISESFGEAGYRVYPRVVCAADYGVPQLRNRVVFIGSRLDVPLSLPEPTHSEPGSLLGGKPYVTVGEAIGDLPLMNGDLESEEWEYASAPTCSYQRYARSGSRSKHVTLHQANGMSDAAREVVRLVKEGHGLRSVPVEQLPARFRRMRKISTGEFRKDCTTLYHRLSRAQPGYTITCYFRNVASGPFVHPVEDRSLSYREAARIMSFKDSYQFRGSNLTRQIGNAVPPLLGKAMGTHVRYLMALAELKYPPEQAVVMA